MFAKSPQGLLILFQETSGKTRASISGGHESVTAALSEARGLDPDHLQCAGYRLLDPAAQLRHETSSGCRRHAHLPSQDVCMIHKRLSPPLIESTPSK